MTISGGSSRTDRIAPPRRRFRLSGPSNRLDPLRFPVRPDLASVALADRVFAPHYAAPVPYRVVAPATLRTAANAGAEELGALAPGAVFNVLDVSGGWAWGQIGDDGAVGYLPADALQHP